MVNIETAISFLYTKVGKVGYSMNGSRNFSDGTADCSGAVYTALRQGGATNLGYIASTETMHGWLIQNGFKLIAENSDWTMKRGDIVIWGKKGYSAGGNGHTGICVDGQNWLECTAWRNLGETQQNHDARWEMNDNPYFYVYRLTNGGATAPTKPVAPENNPGIPAGFTPESGTFVNGDTPIMNRIGSASTMATAAGYLPAGETWEYDSWAKIGNYTWIHHSYNGLDVYLPVRQWPAGTPWGEFK